MINADMRVYEYYKLGEDDGYGMPTISATPAGTIKMALYIINQSITDTVKYKNVSYTGLTHDDVTDQYIIQNGTEKLKVLYVQPKGRFKQVYLSKI